MWNAGRIRLGRQKHHEKQDYKKGCQSKENAGVDQLPFFLLNDVGMVFPVDSIKRLVCIMYGAGRKIIPKD